MWRLFAFILPVIRVYLIGVKVLLYQLFYRSFTLPALPRQNGTVAIVTGGARGMGYETSRHLASLGTHVVIAGNEEEEGLRAVRRIQKESGHRKVEFMYLELASLKSVRQFVQRFKARGLPLHTLVNNAGVMLVPERKTVDGFELHFGLNYLGHFLLTNLLLDVLSDSGHSGRFSRVVTVSSATHYGGRLDLNDLQGRSCYCSHGAYSQSKLALVLFTYHLQERLWARGDPVTANVVDPGMVDTDLYQNLCSPAQLAKNLWPNCSLGLRLKEHPRPFTSPPRLNWRVSAACTCTTAIRRAPQQAPTINSCRRSCGPRAVPWWVFRKPEGTSENI
ncbi:hypothetical protein HF521_012779 [Silurus meridionalis]|uniref:Dehydrogenase/reductase SDR family member on chromosome X n=1 Tax=Silurus meridionalis TaxID=175797 RepID=A0A8T0AFN6_SILME|nr:hypothetical protein HF521_012779 [Silurus meridionalis]